MNHHKLLSKKSLGSAGLLLFLILVSQARLFDFLITSSLGRLFLIVTLLCLSYCHQMLGIVAVLVIVIAFNQFGIASMEGFDTTDTGAKTATDSTSSTTTDDSKDKSKTPSASEPVKSTTSTSTPDTSDKDKATEIHNATRGLEGFDVLGIENNLKRGKQSNTIPVSSYSRQDSDFISAYEGASSIFGNFSFF